ncbi:hypothetical protein BN59_00928 [Legionella massiliensis]|uniref:Uncharacterized protein n=2 Tax=Legionella massiliensis TaxID=1034943 RepID=A0A078KY10_9GAMM|nr:hypothetical protein BN59_00928 [Legionella massiliensis]CEE12392.1 hypothetical protein BN1094_00928 [Legionella massiliensis]
MDFYLPNSLANRRDLFLQEVANRLNELKEQSIVDIESLSSNELFSTIIYNAIKESLTIHENEKREYLKNAVINTALEINITDELQLRFISVISSLTQSHIQLLKLFEERDVSKIKSYESLFALCEFPGNKDEFRMFCHDLLSHSLINISVDFDDFEDVAASTKIIADQSEEEAPYIRITSIGYEFLRYIGT